VAGRESNAAKASGAPWLDDDLPSQTNRYLFSAAGAEGDFEILIAKRWMLLFGASLAALLVGLALMYVPLLRGARVLTGAAAILLIAVLIWPEPALLLAQAATFGVCLALLALLLQKLVARGNRHEMTPSGRAISFIERSSQRIPFRTTDEGKAATTTASIAVEVYAEGSGMMAGDADQPKNGDANRSEAEPAVGASGSSRKNQVT
jgi:hypothetical protein